VLYTIVISALAVTAVAVGRRSSRTLVIVGLVAIAFALVAVGIALLSGNIALYYLGSMSMLFGLVVLLGSLIGRIARERESTRFP
jgi:hypothetical protein